MGFRRSRNGIRQVAVAQLQSYELVALEARVLLSGTTASANFPLSSVPALHSDPGAPAEIYLDFVGAPPTTWGTFNVPQTPAYDTDGDPTTFSSADLANIKQIWARVSEAYSPFNIDVTTVDPGTYPDGKVQRVVIGGDGLWASGGEGRIGGNTFVGSFVNGPNTSYVFSENLNNGDPKDVGLASAHEAGHSFGLQHQSVYDAAGVKTSEYNDNNGSSLSAPIMGTSYNAARGLWWKGTDSLSAHDIQNDMAVIASPTNGFGFRPITVGQTIGTATPLTVQGDAVSASGVIEHTSQTDIYAFTTGAGTITLNGNVAPVGPMLDLKLVLMDANGNVLATQDTASLGESLTMDVPAGSYRLEIASHGTFGDVGQYSVSGTIVPAASQIPAPSALTASVTAGDAVDLSWHDNTTDETAFRVSRSSNGGTTWAPVVVLPANTTSYEDNTAALGSSYVYRVVALTPEGRSPFSNLVPVTTLPQAATGLSAIAMNPTQVDLSWNDTVGETGFQVKRSSNGLTGWTVISTTAAHATTFSDTTAVPGTTYFYRVRAVNASGRSAASNTVKAVTALTGTPNTPTNLTASRQSGGSVKLAWQDMSSDELGFRVMRSQGISWSPLATVAAEATSFTDLTASAGTAYSYRVRAFDAAGASAHGNTVSLPAAASLPPPSLSLFSATSISFQTLDTAEIDQLLQDPALM